jgi:hypothetical protein
LKGEEVTKYNKRTQENDNKKYEIPKKDKGDFLIEREARKKKYEGRSNSMKTKKQRRI